MTNDRTSGYPEKNYPSLEEKDNFGICFSGGGNRSAVATLGELRALHASGILERARYISAVSGGSWGSAPWVFMQDASPEASTRFLGPYIPPEKLTRAELKEEAPKGSFAYSASNSGTSVTRALRRLGGDENFSLELGNIYLTPEVHGKNLEDRVPIYGQKALESALEKNPERSADDFLVCNENRPYFIAGAAVSRRDYPVYRPEKLFTPFEFTTNYAGARPFTSQRPIIGLREIPVGGGYVDNTIYDGIPVQVNRETENRASVTVRKAIPFSVRGASSRLSLSDIMGASGSAPTVVIPGLADVFGFPEFIHSSPRDLDLVRPPELLHTDGGAVENLGIMPLLARGVKNILVFANVPSPYVNGKPQEEDITATDKGKKKEQGMLPPDIGYLFGKVPPKNWVTGFPDRQLARMNHVLADPRSTKSDEMIKDFNHAFTKGKILFHRNTYWVIDQPFHGVKGGWRVNICWIVLASKEKVGKKDSNIMTLQGTEWYQALPSGEDQGVRELLMEHADRDLKNFPYYKTFVNNAINSRSVISLNALQVNTLAHYTSYSVMKNSESIKQHLSISSTTSR